MIDIKSIELIVLRYLIGMTWNGLPEKRIGMKWNCNYVQCRVGVRVRASKTWDGITVCILNSCINGECGFFLTQHNRPSSMRSKWFADATADAVESHYSKWMRVSVRWRGRQTFEIASIEIIASLNHNHINVLNETLAMISDCGRNPVGM